MEERRDARATGLETPVCVSDTVLLLPGPWGLEQMSPQHLQLTTQQLKDPSVPRPPTSGNEGRDQETKGGKELVYMLLSAFLDLFTTSLAHSPKE